MTFTVIGRPQGKQRHRTGKGRMYTPSQTLAYQKRIAQAFRVKFKGQPHAGPVKLEVVAHLPRPKSHYGTGRNAQKLKPSAPLWPLLKPDFDNIEKIVADALNGIAFLDDKQIVDSHCLKVYEIHGSVPNLRVTVEFIEQETMQEHAERMTHGN